MGLQLFKIAKLLAYLEPPSPSVVGLLADAVEMLSFSHGPAGRVTEEAKQLLSQLRDEIRAQESFRGLAIHALSDTRRHRCASTCVPTGGQRCWVVSKRPGGIREAHRTDHSPRYEKLARGSQTTLLLALLALPPQTEPSHSHVLRLGP